MKFDKKKEVDSHVSVSHFVSSRNVVEHCNSCVILYTRAIIWVALVFFILILANETFQIHVVSNTVSTLCWEILIKLGKLFWINISVVFDERVFEHNLRWRVFFPFFVPRSFCLCEQEIYNRLKCHWI
jgi:hypothetical protein